jgi:thioredoxin-like negative regulator of GroEL
VQSSFDEVQFRSRKAAALYACLQEAIDQLPAAHRATALLNLSAYCELLPAAKRLPEMQRLLRRQGDPSLDALRGTLLKNFSIALDIVHPQDAQPAAAFLLNESKAESRDIRDTVRKNLRSSVGGLLLHAHVSMAIKAAIDAE